MALCDYCVLFGKIQFVSNISNNITNINLLKTFALIEFVAIFFDSFFQLYLAKVLYNSN